MTKEFRKAVILQGVKVQRETVMTKEFRKAVILQGVKVQRETVLPKAKVVRLHMRKM